MSARPLGLTRTEKPAGLYDRLELLLFLGVLILAVSTAPFDSAGLPNAPFKEAVEQGTGGGLCVFKRWSGFGCGGCGMTRAFVQLAHGSVLQAVLLNPMAPFVFLWLLARTLQLLAHTLLGRRLEYGFKNHWKWRFYGFCLVGFLVLTVTRFSCGALGVPQLL